MRNNLALLLLCLLVLIPHVTTVQASESWVMSFDPALGSIGEVVTLRVVLQAREGLPINNAIVVWSADGTNAFLTEQDAEGKWSAAASKVTVDSALDHVNNGIYEKKVQITQAGHVRVLAYTQSGTTVYDTSAYILGRESYSVSVISSPLLATVSGQSLDIMVAGSTGAPVTTLDTLRIEGIGVSASLGSAKLTDFDNDGKVDGYRIVVSPHDVGQLTVLAATAKGNTYGQSTVPVLPPPVSVSPIEVLTDSWSERLTLASTLVDKDGKQVPFSYRIKGDGASFSIQDVLGQQAGGYSQFYQGPDVAAQHELALTPQASLATTTPRVTIEASFDGLNWAIVAQFALTPLTIKVDTPTLLVHSANWVKAKVLNGRGEPCAMAEVQLLDAWGLTDNSGEVTLLVTPSSLGRYPLRVRTSNNTYVEQFITVAADAIVTPAPGQKRVTLQLGTPNIDLGLDQPPVLIGGRVLLPFRWFGEAVLGATVDYYIEQGREVITLERARTSIKLILGERGAYINGRGMLLDAAPIVSGGRTLVPARFLAETFGYKVTWLEETNQVIIEQR